MEGVDRINELRDEILVNNIMSRLDCTTKELIRTTATISKRWINLWTQLPNLIFSYRDDDTYFGNDDTDLQKTKNINVNSEFKSRANSWIPYAISRNVEDVDLWLQDVGVGQEEFTFEDELFFKTSCITRMTLTYCRFNPPNGAISWEILECSCLNYVTLDEDMIEKILSGSPCLESLELTNCHGYRRIDVTSRSVKKLIFSDYYWNEEDYIDCIKINAPYISSLTIKGEFEVEPVLLDVSSLIKAELDYCIDPGMSDDITHKEMLRRLLESLDHVKDVIIKDFWWEFYSNLKARGDMSNAAHVGAAHTCIDKERQALLDFKAPLQDPRNKLSTWRPEEEDDCCQWSGVRCNNQTGHVTELDLFAIILVWHNPRVHCGVIPRSIGSFTKLIYLELSDNVFYGTIPREFGNLTNLEYLHLDSLGSCRVENLDWLSSLSSLEDLTMDGTSLAKANNWVNVIIGLQNLYYLSLVGCDLSHVMHPYSSSVNSSSSINWLFLQKNNLNSPMYSWLCPLFGKKLAHLVISGNTFDGNLSHLLNILSTSATTLEALDASSNQFTGSLSDEIETKTFSFLDNVDTISDTVSAEYWNRWKSSQLSYLDLSFNNISGKLPKSLSNHDLVFIDLSFNCFDGPIPAFPAREIPPTMSEMTLLNNLDMSFNDLSGRIPLGTQLQTFNASRYIGNPGLCGRPLPNKCSGDEDLGVPPVGESDGDGESTDELQRWFYIGGATGFATAFWIACSALLFNRRLRHAFFHFHNCLKDWVYVKVAVLIAKFQRAART
ncbi:leucine-rich repeat-containing protein [Tanacetum coccineum]